ncbi:hypothetical protein ScPMuIL_012168 [Solemya velum]
MLEVSLHDCSEGISWPCCNVGSRVVPLIDCPGEEGSNWRLRYLINLENSISESEDLTLKKKLQPSSIKMSVIPATKNSILLFRGFSRSALPLKLSQAEEASLQKGSDSWIVRSAMAMSLLGISFSVFSTRQLSEDTIQRLKK